MKIRNENDRRSIELYEQIKKTNIENQEEFVIEGENFMKIRNENDRRSIELYEQIKK